MEEFEDKESHSDGDHLEILGTARPQNDSGVEEVGSSPAQFDLLDLSGPSGSLSGPQLESTIDSTFGDLFNSSKSSDVEPSPLQPHDGALPLSQDDLSEPQSLLAVEPVEHDLLGTQDPVQDHTEETDSMNMKEPDNTDQLLNNETTTGDHAAENSELPLSQVEVDEATEEQKLTSFSAGNQPQVALQESSNMKTEVQPDPSGFDGGKPEMNGNGEEGRAAKEPDPVFLFAETDKRVEQLERELSTAQAVITSLKIQQDDVVVQELQSKLEEQMSLKAEAENQARLAAREISGLKAMYNKMAEEIQDFQEIKSNVEQQMSAKAEAEHEARTAKKKAETLEAELDNLKERLNELESSREQERSAANEAKDTAKFDFDRIEQLEKDMIDRDGRIKALEEQLTQACQEVDSQRHEVRKLREEREELLRKEVSLTSRLNAAKMKESDESNLAEQYESEIKAVEDELKSTKSLLFDMTAQKQKLEHELETLQDSSNERVHHAEHALAEERRLNEERKKKMKVFVENKAEELRQAKEENDALQLEVNQTNSSLLELNNRWKQVQAQYAQSQSRNRELQMDLNRIKKDSENLHRVGDTLEMKLSKSATETEEHKNKRLAAKHELMTVLRSLENEKKLTARLRDTIKFTFTPKALSQQKLLQENLDDFDAQLQKLTQRLGKPIPPSTASVLDTSETESGIDNHTTGGHSDTDIERLIAKLERETQVVSQCIMELSGNLERMHMVLDSNGDRTCVSAIADLLLTGSIGSSSATLQPGATIIGGQARLASRHRYGSVPSSTANT